ncbi:hypothetical protein [Accumulibacter sp.]|uniref:hypothetical protein n=1 Tax=Accumulibacter sp. TaxID=2053492 RepID=UPI001A5BBB23|nr:hypothetical protein [Accumulibacter sp.]MBL8401733.1 hypothetical protein [Accumulibacter sp.]
MGRPLIAALRAGAGKTGEPPPFVLLMLIGGIGLLVSALFASASIILAAAGVAALTAAATLWRWHRAASRYNSLTQVGYASELQRDAECFDDYLEEVSSSLSDLEPGKPTNFTFRHEKGRNLSIFRPF